MAGAQAGMDVVGSAIGGWINKGNSKSLMRYQNQLAVENWRMQNEYNHPAAQMARLREAGLNPSLFYSSGQGVNSNSTNPGAPTPSSAANVDLSGLGASATQTYLASQMQKQQLKNMQVQNDATAADTQLKLIKYALELEKVPYFKEAARAWRDKLLLDNQVSDSQVKNLEAKTTETMAATQNLYATFDQIKATTRNIDQDTVSKKIHSAVQQALAWSQIKLNDKQIKLLESQITQLYYSNGAAEINLDIMKQTKASADDNGSWYDLLTKTLPVALWNNFIVR